MSDTGAAAAGAPGAIGVGGIFHRASGFCPISRASRIRLLQMDGSTLPLRIGGGPATAWETSHVVPALTHDVRSRHAYRPGGAGRCCTAAAISVLAAARLRLIAAAMEA